MEPHLAEEFVRPLHWSGGSAGLLGLDLMDHRAKVGDRSSWRVSGPLRRCGGCRSPPAASLGHPASADDHIRGMRSGIEDEALLRQREAEAVAMADLDTILLELAGLPQRPSV